MKITRLTALTAAGGFAIALAGCAPMASDGGSAQTASAEQTVMVGGAEMYPSRNIVENAANSADHTTLVAAVQEAGLVNTLSSPGPFTVFAPTNAAFEELPPGTVDALLQPENRPVLTDVLTYHVVPGQLTASNLVDMAAASGGQATLDTASGGTLTVMTQGGGVMLRDDKGRTANVTTANVMQSNGVIHVIDTVLLPG